MGMTQCSSPTEKLSELPDSSLFTQLSKACDTGQKKHTCIATTHVQQQSHLQSWVFELMLTLAGEVGFQMVRVVKCLTGVAYLYQMWCIHSTSIIRRHLVSIFGLLMYCQWLVHVMTLSPIVFGFATKMKRALAKCLGLGICGLDYKYNNKACSLHPAQ